MKRTTRRQLRKGDRPWEGRLSENCQLTNRLPRAIAHLNAKPYRRDRRDKQWGRPRARRLNLLKLGAPRDRVKLASRSRKGHWRVSNGEIVRNALNNAWLESQGLHSLEEQWVNVRYPKKVLQQPKGK